MDMRRSSVSAHLSASLVGFDEYGLNLAGDFARTAVEADPCAKAAVSIAANRRNARLRWIAGKGLWVIY
jgi:hypothetical protein